MSESLGGGGAESAIRPGWAALFAALALVACGGGGGGGAVATTGVTGVTTPGITTPGATAVVSGTLVVPTTCVIPAGSAVGASCAATAAYSIVNSATPSLTVDGVKVSGTASGTPTLNLATGTHIVAILDVATTLKTATVVVSQQAVGTKPSNAVLATKGGVLKNICIYVPADGNTCVDVGGTTASCLIYDQVTTGANVVNCGQLTNLASRANYAIDWTSKTLVPFAGTPLGTSHSTGYNGGANPYASCGVGASLNGLHVILSDGSLIYTVSAGFAYELRKHPSAATAAASSCAGYTVINTNADANNGGAQYLTFAP